MPPPGMPQTKPTQRSNDLKLKLSGYAVERNNDMDIFEQELDQFLGRNTGGKNPAPIILSDNELAELILSAKSAKTLHASVWVKFRRLLSDFTDLNPEGQKATFRECRITADLGQMVYGVEEFVAAFL